MDERFYEITSATAMDLSLAAGAAPPPTFRDRVISSVSSADDADGEALTFVESAKPTAPETLSAGLVFAPADLADKFADTVAVVATPHPRWAFAKAAALIARPRRFEPDAPLRHPDAQIEDGVEIGPNVAIAAGAKIGRGTIIGPGSVIGPGVAIGRNCRIGANVAISCALIGDNVTILAGVTIGETGFGLATGADGAIDTPHFGRVIIQDHVSIGANTTVDRGLFDDTFLGEQVKIDNLCQIAHNVRVQPHAVIVAFGGISGSVEIGAGAVLGGRVGVADHVKIGAGAKLGAGSATMNDVPEGEAWGGYPAKPIRTWMREVAWVGRQAQKRPSKS
ncbi:MAG: UDP-3-O-(3-hydroxymyristoyl)glucosamine N-acyltransferase [Pseudomonadota bacterium]